MPEIATLCDVCGKRLAGHTCALCGRRICDEHFDTKSGLCTPCLRGRAVRPGR